MSENHTFILQDVINDLIDTNSSLESALFKLNYFARLIKNDDLLNYTNAEINGYKEIAPPEYRKAIATLTVQMQAGYHSHTAEVPISMLEEPFNTEMQYREVREGIKVLERMAASSAAEGSPLIRTDLPMEMLRYVQPAATKLYKSDVKLTVVRAMITSNANIITQIISTVRSRLLAFSMEIAEKFGYNIEITSFRKLEVVNNQTINNIIKTEITNTGDGNIINTGKEAQLEVSIAIKKTSDN